MRRTGASGDLPVHRERSQIPFGGVVVRWNVGPAEEGQDAVKVLVQTALQARDVHVQAEAVVEDKATEPDTDAVLRAWVLRTLGLAAVGRAPGFV